MSKFTNFLLSLSDNDVKQIYQGVIAKIDTFDQQTMRATVDIQLKDLDIPTQIEIDLGLLQNIPVGFISGGGGYYIRPFYKKNDLVWITFSSYEIRNALRGSKLQQTNGNKFDLSYAMVSHGLFKDTEIPPTPFTKDGLLIGFGDNTFINILNNNIEMQTGTGHNYKLDETGKHSWNDGEVTLEP